MNGIDKIIARMEADTQAECADIAAQAAAEAEAILARYRAEADKLLREGEARCKVLEHEQVERLEGGSRLACRQRVLAEKQRMLDEAIHTAQTELDSMAERSAPTEQAIFLFQSMMLEDEGMMNEVRFQIKAGVGAAEAMDRVGRRYAERLANMKDNAYMQLRSVDILDATSRVVI